MRFISFLSFCLCLLPLYLSAQNGLIKGRVIDLRSNTPLEFATIAVEGTSFAALSDENGEYEISGLSPGLYNVGIQLIGYKSLTEYEVQVSNSKPAIVDFALSEDVSDLGVVEVKASPFVKTEESPVSLRTIGTAEIQRNPGGNRDISKVIRVLPGVTSASSFRNDLLIRGGAPNENRFYLDDVEVPNINHFATQGASGGPNGLINVDFIREVDFYSGAFPANRGNSLSSVFQFKQKNGRDDRIGATATLGTSDLALTLEGPLSKSKNTTFLLSARQSYLQFLFRAIGLPILPTYNDFQLKVRHKIDDKSEFYVVGLGALDRFRLNLEANETAEQRYLLNNIPINNQWNYTLGAVYKRYTSKGAWTFVLSRNMLNNDIFKYPNNDESQTRSLDYNSQESENKLRIENTSRYAGNWKLNYGLAYQANRFTINNRFLAQVGNNVEPLSYESLLWTHQYGLFGQLSKKTLKDRLVLSFGARMDGISYSEKMANPLPQFSPRFSAAYALTERMALNFNTGIYYQLPPYIMMGYRENGELVNRERLDYIRSSHIVAGWEYNSSTSTKFSIEGYYKYYQNYPFLLNEQLTLANIGNGFGVIGNGPATSIKDGRAMGLEFLVQQRLYKGFYGILSYTLGKTEFQDVNGNFVPSSWDSRHIVNLALGKNWDIVNAAKRESQNARRTAAGQTPIGKKLIPQTLELGFNTRFQTGLPYTPFDLQSSALRRNWDRIGQGILDYSRLNTLRSEVFYAFDFRIDYKWFFPKWSLNLYLDIQNLPGVVIGQPTLILDQGEDGQQPVQIVNQGQPNESYRLRQIPAGAGTSVPTLGIIVQY